MLTSVRIVGRGNEAVARLTMAFVAAIEKHRKAEDDREASYWPFNTLNVGLKAIQMPQR